MAQIHTHYDNLKVARNAPPEVIRAAYKILSQKFHPDRNPGSVEAARVMSIMNVAYDVLSDPKKRQDHDLWIAQQERLSSQSQKPNSTSPSTQQQRPHSPPQQKTASDEILAHVLRNWFIYGIAAFSFYFWATNEPTTPPFWATDEPTTPAVGPKPYQASPTPPLQPQYVRPSAAPNGQPWPASAGYVKGYQRLHTGGLSSVTVDNSGNDSDVFVKLVSLASAEAYPVRQFVIPAFGSFTLSKVRAGSYDIRYRDLSNGGLSRSESFNLEETATYSGTQFSNLTMTLYKVKHGNMQTYGLAEKEF